MNKQRIPIIAMACVDEDYAIGYNENLLYKFPEDMKYFKNFTTNQIVVMGRKTFESMNCKPLPNRINVVLSRKFHEPITLVKIEEPFQNGVLIYANDLETLLTQKSLRQCVNIVNGAMEKLNISHRYEPTKAVVIGGSEIYKHAIEKNLVDEFRLTQVRERYENATGITPTHKFPIPCPDEVISFNEGLILETTQWKRYNSETKKYDEMSSFLKYQILIGEYLK